MSYVQNKGLYVNKVWSKMWRGRYSLHGKCYPAGSYFWELLVHHFLFPAAKRMGCAVIHQRGAARSGLPRVLPLSRKKKKKAFGYFPILFCSQTAVFALGKQIILALLVTVRKRWTEQCRRISLSSDQELPELAFPWKCYRAKSFVRITDRLLLLSVIDFSSVLLCARG